MANADHMLVADPNEIIRRAFAGADVRRQIGALIRAAQAHDVAAITHLEQALNA